MKAAVIIPVFNEGERVLAVTGAAMDCEAVKEVIVVDDGSTDQTSELLKTVDDITVLTHSTNKGKGEALDSGMQLIQNRGYDTAVFLDGDLQGISPDHVSQLLNSIEGGSCMAIGYLGLRKEIVKKAIYTRWGGLSGQRAIKTEVWDLLTDRDKHGFNVEAALNARMRKAHLHRSITRSVLEGVSHIGKREKEDTLLQVAHAYSKTYGAALLTYARIELGG